MAELLGLGAVAQALRFGQPRFARRRADGAVQPRGAQPVKEPPVHAFAVEQAHGSAIAVRQNGFRPELRGDGLEARGNGIQRLLPGDPLETAFAFRAHPALRVEQAPRRVFVLQILSHFPAQKSARYGMPRVAAQPRAASVFDRDQQGTAVRTVERAHRVADLYHAIDYIVRVARRP